MPIERRRPAPPVSAPSCALRRGVEALRHHGEVQLLLLHIRFQRREREPSGEIVHDADVIVPMAHEIAPGSVRHRPRHHLRVEGGPHGLQVAPLVVDLSGRARIPQASLTILKPR